MGFSPCCCSLQAGTKAIAIFELVIGVLLTILSLIVLIAGAGSLGGDDAEAGGAVIAIGIILLIVCILRIALAAVLWQAARDLNERKARTWLIITGILFAIHIISFIVVVAKSPGVGASSGISLVLTAYFIWVVIAFRNEIVDDPNSAPRYPPNQS
ncbi:uncharacterized protein LOC110850101 [Folsomia candida]|uniref:Uncharacterized protein n=1 Tax=Folsomia candida TaxID=158441 RepID=A0A226EBC5_FOLCA|nr:uncharacterized protein LOC110850101 [Folsomia candida]OXA54843.1 hypothetical protein Fcan01_10223 [Folsomia candida]